MRDKNEDYLNRVPGIDECVELEDYLNLWIVSEGDLKLKEVIK